MRWWDDRNGGRRFGIDVGVADFDREVGGEMRKRRKEIVHRWALSSLPILQKSYRGYTK